MDRPARLNHEASEDNDVQGSLALASSCRLCHRRSRSTAISLLGLPLSTIAGIQGTNADSRMFCQRSDNSIWQTCISGHGLNGRTTCDNQVVPRTEALGSTPLAAVAIPDLSEWHLFFVSPTNTLSEYIYQQSSISPTNPSGIRGGTSCTDCITNEQFAVIIAKNKALNALYQVENDRPKLRVWFASAGRPNTVMEAGKNGDQIWK
ncbi:hypothetical protein PM082_020239 [Marasmius tenuissimus]|nr:hypothetical protein PM082_020239 [Marasmius tenuissimus]